MAFDDVLRKYVGEFGRHQILVTLVLNILSIPGSFDVMEIIFSQATPPFWLKGLNATSHNASDIEPCDCSVELNGTLQEQLCTEWQYDDSVFESTLVTQFDLVCDRAWINSFASSVYLFSYSIAFPLGLVSDRFGRKPCLIISVVLGVISRFLQVYSPTITVFISARFFVGTFHNGQYTTAFVLGPELVGPSQRLLIGTLPCISWIIGCFVIEGYAFFIRNRIHFELVSTIITALTLPLLWFVPESPRWLCSQGRYQEAYQIMKQMATVNGREFPESDDENLWHSLKFGSEIDSTRETTFNALKNAVSSRVIVLRALAMAFSWFILGLAYYALTLNSGKLAGDIYLNTFLTTLVELPGYLGLLFTLSTALGRSISISSAHIVTAVLLLASVPLAAGTAATALSLLGKFFISYAFAAVYVYAMELFPTTVRNVGLGFCSFAARIGSALAPLVVSAFVTHVGGALLIGIVSLLAGLILLCLPETRVTKLPQTIPDAEAMTGFLFSKCRSKEKDDLKRKPDEEVSALDVAT